MSFDRLVEEKIREAMEAGEFDNLAGRGRPLDLKPYFDTPEDLRLAYSLLKSSGFVPEEAQLLKEIEALQTRLGRGLDDQEGARLMKSLEEKRLKLNLMLEQRKGRRRA
jgi:DnaJ homologue, subfamily C, member 28, conserved domain